jgi:hypothetical protein
VTRPGEPAARHPAPGSQVPGAPPPLRRPLTPADGVTTSAPEPAPQDPPRTDARNAAAVPGASQWTAAAAMIGVAAGLELAGALSRIGAGRYRSKVPKR